MDDIPIDNLQKVIAAVETLTKQKNAPVTKGDVEDLLKKDGYTDNTDSNLRKCSVNSPSLYHPDDKTPRRRYGDEGRDYDRLFWQNGGTYRLYDPGNDGKWETYRNAEGKVVLRRVDEACERQVEFESAVKKASESTSAERKKRLSEAKKIPESRTATTTVYQRNPDVVAEVLSRANGFCEACRNEAPFIKRSNGLPYLEVHHRIRLADGGEDTIENTTAVCPNCHRQAHFG